MRKAWKIITIAAIISCMFGTVAMAASSPTSVTIYTNKTSVDSTSIYCSGYIDGYGVNDSSSSNSLYYVLRFKQSVGSKKSYSKLMAPGTGSMGSTSVSSWSTLFTKKSVPDGSGNYFIRLNPHGATSTGCYGAGKLVD